MYHDRNNDSFDPKDRAVLRACLILAVFILGVAVGAAGGAL